MAADPADLQVTPGSGARVATYEISEETFTRILQRVGVNTAEGEDVAVGSFVTVQRAVARPADTTTYTANDAWSTSTSSPTVGGNLLDGLARQVGKSGVITDVIFTLPVAPSVLLQGELWLFDNTVTAMNDNAAWNLSDADLNKLIGVVPFTMQDTNSSAGNSYCHVQGLQIGFTTDAALDDLYFLVKVKNAYVPSSGESLLVRVKAQRTS